MLTCLVSGVEAANVVAWGLNELGQCDIPEELKSQDIIAVDAGDSHTMALTSNNDVYAWGDNFFDQCDVPINLKAKAIACGGYHSLAINLNGEVVGWGSNNNGESFPTLGMGNGHNNVAAGYYVSMASTIWSNVRTWGREINNPPSFYPNKVIKIASGDTAFFIITEDNEIHALGSNAYGLCDVPAGLKAVDIACSDYHAIALTPDGEVVGWGDYYDPPPAPLTRKVIAIACSEWSSACIFDDYSVYVWGDLSYDMEYNYGQHNPPDGLKADMIAGGYCHFIARKYTAPSTPIEPAPTLQWSPETGYYTGYWFNRNADFINVEGLFSAILLPFTALIGQWFFMIVWGTLVMGIYLHTQDTTLPFVIGILLGAVISISAGAEGATVMYLTMAFAGGGVLAKLLLGRS